jgi:hypothetical protein
MSASDGSKHNGRPSLLNGAPAASTEAKENGSRILAALEGRVDAPSDTTARRGKARLIGLGLMLVGVVCVAALVVPRRLAGHREDASLALPAPAAASSAEAVKPASGTDLNPSAKSDASAAPQAATIVTVAPDALVSGSAVQGVPAVEPGHSRIADALAAGSDTASAGGTIKAKESKASKKAAHEEKAKLAHDEAKARAKHELSETHAAAAHTAKKPSTPGSSAKTEDPDADLLAVLVSRTKPFKGKAAPAGAASTSAPASAPAAKLSFADQIKACQKQGFFASEVCRWRICEGHWGHDPACPSGQQSPTTQSNP